MRSISLLACLALSTSVYPCISVAGKSPNGRASIPVFTQAERAVIVWDSKQQVEHFVREANFDTDARGFGFLVPTPSTPSLAAASPRMFDTVKDIASLHRPKAFAGGGAGGGGFGGVTRAGVVEIVMQQTVAGYDATVLRASDASAAEIWLGNNGYFVSPVVKQWLQPYIEKGWTITAFKISNAAAGKAGLSPVVMTFSTSKPFYPYREPLQPKRNGRARGLDLYVVSDIPLESSFGVGKWISPTASFELSGEEQNKILAELPRTAVRFSRMALYEDRSDPRDGRFDLFFEPAKSSSSKTGGLLASCVALLVSACVLRRRK